MAQAANHQTPIIKRMAECFLWLGEAVCNLFKIEDSDSRMLLRMFVNLTIYGKLSVLIALMVF